MTRLHIGRQDMRFVPEDQGGPRFEHIERHDLHETENDLLAFLHEAPAGVAHRDTACRLVAGIEDPLATVAWKRIALGQWEVDVIPTSRSTRVFTVVRRQNAS